jgi:ribonuclease P protein component
VHKKNKLGKESRLSTAESFQQVFKNAKRFKTLGITVLTHRNHLTFSRIGISVPKRQVPRAVDRNKIRRHIRESFRIRKQQLTVNLDIVFLAYSEILEKNNDEIRTCLDFLWEKLNSFYEKV